MISINNGPQGLYITGEGLEQKLFYLNNSIVLFDGDVNTKILKCADYYKDGFGALVQRASRDYTNGSMIVCGVEGDSAVVYSAGDKNIKSISAGYSSDVVRVESSAESLLDFVDFVEHSQSTQFGFVACNKSAGLFSSVVKIDKYAPAMYQKKELSEFCRIAFSWFNTISQKAPADLKVYVQNLCGLDVAKVSALLSSSANTKGYVYDCAREQLLSGTSVYKECVELISLFHQRDRSSRELIEQLKRNLSLNDKRVAAAMNWVRVRDDIIIGMYSLLKNIEQHGPEVFFEMGSGALDAVVKTINEQHKARFGSPLEV